MIKAILSDLDNTLYAYKPCDEAGMDAVVSEASKILKCEKDLINQEFLKARNQVKKQIPNTAAAHSRLLYFHKMLENITNKSNTELSVYLNDLFWQKYFQKMSLYDEMRMFFKSAKQENKTIAIVTNLTSDVQFKKIGRLGLANVIDYIITSEEAGAEKPDPKIFNLALEKVKCAPNECLFMGDDEESDRNGALNAGMNYLHTLDGKISYVLFQALS